MVNVAQMILAQLGGSRAAAMIGIKHAITRESGLGVRFAAKALDGINHIEITLDEATDIYNVAFWLYRGVSNFRQVDSAECVHVDELRRVIENRTGLRLSL